MAPSPYKGTTAFRWLYAAALVAISVHTILFLSRLEAGPTSLFTLVLLPSLLLVLTYFGYSYVAVRHESFRLASQLSIVLILFGLVNVVISLNNIAVFGLFTTIGLVSGLAMLPDISLMFVGASLRTFGRSGSYGSLSLAFKSFLVAIIVGRIGISLYLYVGDVEAILAGGLIRYFTVGNVVQFVLTFGLLIPVAAYVLLRMSRTGELKSVYVAMVGIAYSLAFFVPRVFDFAYAALFGFPYTVFTERLAVFIQGILLLALFGRIGSERSVIGSVGTLRGNPESLR